MTLTNGMLVVTGRMCPKHGASDIYAGATLKFTKDAVYTPGAGDANPRWTHIRNGGTLDLTEGALNPFNARFVIHPGGTVRLGIDLESRPHGNKWYVKGGRLEITDHVILGMNEFFIDTNAVLEVDVAKGKYADFSRVTLAPGAKIKETGKGVLIRSHDDPRWKKSETVRTLERMDLPHGKGAFWLCLAWDYPAARREAEEFPSFRPFRLEFWRTLATGVGVVRAAQPYTIDGPGAPYVNWSVYRDRIYLLNTDCVSPRTVVFDGKTYTLSPKELRAIPRAASAAGSCR